MTIAEAYRRYSKLSVREQIPVIIELTKDEIILLNQTQLYNHSIRKDGTALGGYAWRDYEEMKEMMNPALGGLVDLYLTGDFYRGFYVEVKDTHFVIGSRDSKSGDLENKYGVGIFGLTDESRATYIREYFFRALRNYIEGITGIKMV